MTDLDKALKLAYQVADEEYGIPEKNAETLFDAVNEKFYLRADESGNISVDGYNYYDGDISEASTIQNFYDAVNDCKGSEEALEQLSLIADDEVSMYIRGEIEKCVRAWAESIEKAGVETGDVVPADEIEELGLEYLNDMVSIDFDHSYEEQEINANLIISTGSEVRFTAENDAGRMADYYVDSVVLDIIKQQGHEVEEVTDCMSEYNKLTIENLEAGRKQLEGKYGVFVASLAEEIANAPTFCEQEFVILARVSVKDFAKLADKGSSFDVTKNVTCGLYNRYDGSGSLLGVELEKPLEINSRLFSEMQIETRYHSVGNFYTVDDAYGLVGRAWKENAVEIMTADERREKDIDAALGIENTPKQGKEQER